MSGREEAHEADGLYRGLDGIESWPGVAVDEGAWAAAAARVARAEAEDPAGTAMAVRGALLAAAYQSAGLDGMYRPEAAVAAAFVRGEAEPPDLGTEIAAHVVANYHALLLPADGLGTQEWIRTAHAVACKPQLMVHDHVLAHGDYKHHANHVATSGGWQAFAPVAGVHDEMARLEAVLTARSFARLHPAAQAAYAHHAVTHVGPFAAGNGRVARVLANAYVRRAVPVPLWAFDDVARRLAEVVDLVERTDPASPPVARWREREAVAAGVRARLPGAVDGALRRHRARTDLGWLAPLDRATVEPVGEGVLVDAGVAREVLIVDAHPLSGGEPVLQAREAGLQVDAAADLDGWLDRAVSTLALRVAAELE